MHGSKNWIPSTFVGTTPSYLRVREWEELEEGETFTEEDVHKVAYGMGESRHHGVEERWSHYGNLSIPVPSLPKT